MTTMEHFYKNVLPYFNIQQYFDAGFYGQGITIASMETIIDDHGKNVYDTLKTYAPLCKVISFTDEHDVSAMGDDNITQQFPIFVEWCIANNVDIVTSSLDWSCDKESEKTAIKKLYDNGIIFCNCAGNDGTHITYDNKKKTYGFDKECLTISGIQLDVKGNTKWSGFNYGEAVDLCTLGSNTPTFNDDDLMYSWSGTSSATPMCAGMLAVYKSFDNELNSKNVFEKIVNKMITTIIYKGYEHKILILPNMEDVMLEKEDNKTPQWKLEFEEVWDRATKLKVVDGTRKDSPITRNELVVILDRLGLIK